MNMDSENSNEITTVHFFGGHADGGTKTWHMPPHSYDFPVKADDAHSKGRPFTRYVHSEAWSHHLGKWTMIAEGCPGKPPREKAAA